MPESLPSWLAVSGEAMLIAIHAQPGAKRDALCGEFNGRLKIALNAPPVDGKANQKLIQFLSKRLGTSKSAISIVQGETSRDKKIRISLLSVSQIVEKLSS